MLEQLADAIHLNQIDGWALLDILVLAVIIYQLLLLIRGTRAAHMLVGVVGLVVIHFLTRPGLLHLAAERPCQRYSYGIVKMTRPHTRLVIRDD